MHAIKGGWVGQTFALAKYNESGGRKPRIRRSKEERKAMVESFIKTYQSSNDGNFPSLNLTHKEVGGSFYTIREIVREVIQENRVLGPAKWTPEEQKLQNADQFLEQYPLGSISTEPQIPFASSPNGTHFIPDYQSTSGEVVVSSDGLCCESENQGLDNGRIINGIQVDVKSEEADDLKCIELQESESSEAKFFFEEETVASKVKVNPLAADAVIETFPSRPVTEPTDSLDARSGEVRDLICILEEKEGEEVELGPPDSSSMTSLDDSHLDNGRNINGSQVDVKNEEADAVECIDLKVSEPSQAKKNLEKEMVASKAKVNPLAADVIVETFPLRPMTKPIDSLDARSGEGKDLTSTLGEKEVKEVELGPSDSSSMNSLDNSGLVGMDDVEKDTSTTKKGIVHDSRGGTGEAKESHNHEGNVFHKDTKETYKQTQAVAEVKTINAPIGTPSKKPNGTYNSKSGSEIISEEAVVIDDKAEVQPSSSTKKGSTPTLDRINLESWEQPSRKSAEPEKNPLLAIFKSFIDAFVKLFSE